MSFACEDVVGAVNWAEVLDISWRRSVLGPDSICVAVVDPWGLRQGVTIAIDTDHNVSEATDDSTPVRTDCVSGTTVVPDTCICDGGAWVGLAAVVGAVEGVGLVSELLA